MEVIPAVDILGGRCVRLHQGRYDRETVFSADPVSRALEWVAEGARRLHLVDLDGARTGRPTNLEVVRRIAEAVDVPVQAGGGVRTCRAVQDLLEAGVRWVVVGTRALREPDWAREMTRRHPGRLILSLDARGGRLALEGWTATSTTSPLEAARQLDRVGFAAFVYTNISRDGTLTGPDLAGTRRLAEAVRTPVIASGGVASLEDVARLAQLPIAGMIVGRALYEGAFRLVDAIDLVRRATSDRSSAQD